MMGICFSGFLTLIKIYLFRPIVLLVLLADGEINILLLSEMVAYS